MKCGCSREMHVSCRGPFDRGCGRSWVDMFYGTDPTPDCIGLIHCPCDGYEPPAGGGPLTEADFQKDAGCIPINPAVAADQTSGMGSPDP